MNKLYCSIDDVKNYGLVEIEETFEDQITSWIESVSNYISLLTNREWLADSVATTRYFDGDDSNNLLIGEAIDIDSVEIDGEEIEYTLFPYNSSPISMIITKNTYFPKGIKNVAITGKFGYSEAVPEDIKLATAIIVVGIIQNQTNQDGEIESEKIGNYTVSYKSDEQKQDFKMAKNILNMRRKLVL